MENNTTTSQFASEIIIFADNWIHSIYVIQVLIIARFCDKNISLLKSTARQQWIESISLCKLWGFYILSGLASFATLALSIFLTYIYSNTEFSQAKKTFGIALISIDIALILWVYNETEHKIEEFQKIHIKRQAYLMVVRTISRGG